MYSLGTVPTFCGNDEKEGGREREKKKEGLDREREWERAEKKGRYARVVIRDGLAGTPPSYSYGRYVGIASRGSLSRTANYGIMHTAGPVPQLWLCYEFVLTQRSPCRRNGCARRRTAATCTTARRRTFISRHLHLGEKGVKAHCALEYWFACLPPLVQSVLHGVTCDTIERICLETETFLSRTIVFLRFFLFYIRLSSLWNSRSTVVVQSL